MVGNEVSIDASRIQAKASTGRREWGGIRGCTVTSRDICLAALPAGHWLTQEITGQIEQRLGTRPGERMNRPDFGGGVDQFPYARLKW